MARKRSYTMTPARREALRKAQLASARKRKLQRQRRRVKIGVVALTGVGAGIVLGHKILHGNPSQSHAVTRPPAAINQRRARHGRPNTVRPRTGVFKAPAQDTLLHQPPRYVKRNRPGYDAQRRSEYAARKKR